MSEKEIVKIEGVELTSEARETIRQQANCFSVPIIIEKVPLGSGTLVQIDDRFGILTAEHVINHIKPELRLRGMDDRKLVNLVLDENPRDAFIDSRLLRIFATDRQTDSHGPDLAFIQLPEGSDLLGRCHGLKNFYNLTKEREERIETALANIGAVYASGWPYRMHKQQEDGIHFHKIQGISGYAIQTKIENVEAQEGWDYLEIPMSDFDIPGLKGTLGGMSGGGIWRAQIGVYEDKPKEGFLHGPMILAGVMFYEDYRENEDLFVRGHGPVSLYNRLVSLVRESDPR
jgi:hypothetical protein